MNTMGQLAKITETQPTSAPTLVADIPQPEQPGVNVNVESTVESTTKQGHLVTTILCQDVANSMTDNTPVIYRVLMAVRVDRLPFLQPLAVATFWLFDAPGVYRVGVRLLSPATTAGSEPGGGSGDRSVLLEASVEVVVEIPGTYHVSTFQFGDVALPLLGQYRAEVFLDGELAGAYPLFVQPRPGPDPEPQPQPQPELIEGAETDA
jgi:hypothetical protein